jgi:hypothetical protein
MGWRPGRLTGRTCAIGCLRTRTQHWRSCRPGSGSASPMYPRRGRGYTHWARRRPVRSITMCPFGSSRSATLAGAVGGHAGRQTARSVRLAAHDARRQHQSCGDAEARGPARSDAQKSISERPQFLAPTLAAGDIIVLDDLSSHKVSGVREAIEACGASLLYLPSRDPVEPSGQQSDGCSANSAPESAPTTSDIAALHSQGDTGLVSLALQCDHLDGSHPDCRRSNGRKSRPGKAQRADRSVAGVAATRDLKQESPT